MGVQEPEVAVVGERAIVVQLPGVEDRERALQAVGTTGQLSFRPVLGEFLESPALTNPESVQPEGDPSQNPILQPLNELDPDTGITIEDDITLRSILEESEGCPGVRGRRYRCRLPGWDRRHVPDRRRHHRRLSPVRTAGDRRTVGGRPEFTDEGGEKFREATAYLSTYPVGDPRRSMAIVIDGSVFSAPQIAGDVPTGEGLDPDSVVITVGGGDNAQQEAEALARAAAVRRHFRPRSNGNGWSPSQHHSARTHSAPV